MSDCLAHPTASAVKAIHSEVLAAHGGSPGIRENSLLESAVAAPIVGSGFGGRRPCDRRGESDAVCVSVVDWGRGHAVLDLGSGQRV